MCDQDDSSEKELIRRQGFLSNSWISFVRTILAQYSLPSLHESFMHIVSSKTKSLWKKTIYQHINSYWKTSINRQLSLYQSLIFLRSSKYIIGKCHHCLESVNSTMRDIQRQTQLNSDWWLVYIIYKPIDQLLTNMRLIHVHCVKTQLIIESIS